MSQAIWNSINPAVTSGNQLATLLNDFKDAVVSGLSGTSRPTELVAGGFWIDTTNDPTSWEFKLYTGTVDISVFILNLATNTASFGSSDSLLTIAKISADDVGPILKLSKERIASSGQVLIGDVLGEIQVVGGADDNSNPVTLRLRTVATDDFTNSESGSYLVLETTNTNSTGLSEFMRIVSSKLGIGTTSPDDSLHVRGTGVRSEKVSDDINPSRVVLRKRRATGTFQVENLDGVGTVLFNSTDDTGTEQNVASIEAVATEDHTSAARGTDIVFKTSKIGSTPSEIFRLTEEQLFLAKYLALDQQVDSTTTGANQSLTFTKPFLKVTNASLTSVNNIAGPTSGKFLLLKNSTGSSLSIVNDTGGTAANRIITGTGADVSLISGSSILLCYDADLTRWTLLGGIAINSIEHLSPLTTKGDIFVRNSSSSTRLGVGTNGFNLVADSAETTGLKWAAPGAVQVSSKTANYTLTTGDNVILGDPSAGAFTLTLPTAVGNTGKSFTIKYAGSTNENKLTINTTSSQTIDDLLTVNMSAPGDVMIVISDGANWIEQGSRRRVGARYSGSTTAAVVGDVILKQPTKTYDNYNSYNTSTGEYAVQEDGLYNIASAWQINAATFSTTQDMTILIYVNAAPIAGGNLGFMVGNGSSNFYTVLGSDTIWLFAGAVVTILLRSTVAGAATTNSYFAINKVSP